MRLFDVSHYINYFAMIMPRNTIVGILKYYVLSNI